MRGAGFIGLLIGGLTAGPAAGIEVTGVEPTGQTAAITSPVRVHFDRPVDRATVTDASFWAFGRWSGAAEGAITFSNGDQTVTLTPDDPLSSGEAVMVILANTIRGADQTPLRSAGYSFMFMTATAPGTLDFTHVATMTTRTNQQQRTRSYGGIGSDLDNDGWLDITIVNEDAADLRVFMNKADGTGAYDPFLQPPAPVGNRASPSEPSDFNRDGNTDICVANINDDTVSILHGNGDGTYAPQQVVNVGSTPRGIAVLDVDGDGDTDIVNTNSDSSNLSLLLNDGNGVFGAPIFFEGGVSGEWALGAADMNADGILDLVVGSRSQQRCIVDLGNGDGTFTPQTSAPCGGGVWMIALGDVDGNGTVDVTCANSFANNGGIMLGNGAGGLAFAQTYPTDPFPLATDVGDLDGDGDLDWVTSSFSGDFFVFTNDGDGTFTFNQEFLAPSAASCALCLDINNDHVLDLALIDELADVLILQRNTPAVSQETICPDDAGDFLKSFGGPVTGDALRLCEADDSRLEVRQSAPVTPLLPFVRLEFWAHTSLGDGAVAQLEFDLEGHVSANVSGGQNPDTLRTSVRNFSTGLFELTDQRGTPSNADVLIEFTIDTNAGDYVNPGDGEIRVRQDVFNPGNVAFPLWFLKVDLYEVTVSN